MKKLLLVVPFVAAVGCGEVLKETQDAPTSTCGNGMREGLEECDDGNTENADDCTSACKTATCGDGIVRTLGTTLEECDDGNTENGDDCTNACKNATCGDGIVRTTGTTTEGCDDGNQETADDCTTACALPTCGDGIVHNKGTATESCEPPGSTNCASTCVFVCPPVSGQAFAGPANLYGYCWYLGNDGQTCDAVCQSIGGANIAANAVGSFADSCSAAGTADVSQWFFTHGNPAGWTTSAATGGHTLGYGYRNMTYYGKCSTGTAPVGTFPGDANTTATRELVCACSTPNP